MGELGEAANNAKKLLRAEQGMPGNKPSDTVEMLTAKLEKELADTVIYLDLAFQRIGKDIAASIMQVFDSKSKCLGYNGPTAKGCQAVEYTGGNIKTVTEVRCPEAEYIDVALAYSVPTVEQVVSCLMLGFGTSYATMRASLLHINNLGSSFSLDRLSPAQRKTAIKYAQRCYREHINSKATGERALFPMWPDCILRGLILKTALEGTTFQMSGDF